MLFLTPPPSFFLQRLVHSCLIDHMRDVLTYFHGYDRRDSNTLTAAMRFSAGLAPPEVFLQYLANSIDPAGAAFSPDLQSRISPVIHSTVLKRLEGVVRELNSREGCKEFEDIFYFFHLAVVNGDTRMLTSPPSSSNVNRSEEDYDYAFDEADEQDREYEDSSGGGGGGGGWE